MYSTLTSLQRKRYLFVCINRRAEENPKGCCAAKDSEEVYRALKGEVAARGLAKLEARVCTSSCLDQCATGVTVLVEPDHFFYGRVTVADVPEIVDGLVKGQPVKRLVVTGINTMELDGMSDIEHVASEGMERLGKAT
jgi:(2Fe-2S) ferredoxin